MGDTGPRVLMVATTLPGEPGDGTPEFVLTLAQHTLPAETTIVAPRVRGCELHQEHKGVHLRRFPYAPRRFEYLADDAILPTLRARRASALQLPGLMLGLIRSTFSAARHLRAEVVHAHWILPAGLVAALVSRFKGTPFIVTAHGADAYALNGRLARRLKRWVLQSADAVYPVSGEIAERLDAISPGCVTRVVPAGVDIATLTAAVGRRSPEPGRLLFVGRLAEKKGVDILLAALADVAEPWTLVIAGDGPERPQLERQASSLGLRSVEFLGHCSASEVATQYQRAAAVVLPSRTGADGDRDGTPVVMMEAMSVGVPIVASNLGGIGEQLTDGVNATLVPEGDPAALAHALGTILAQPDYAQQLGARAARHAAAELDAVKLGRQLGEDLSVLTRPQLRTPAAASL